MVIDTPPGLNAWELFQREFTKTGDSQFERQLALNWYRKVIDNLQTGRDLSVMRRELNVGVTQFANMHGITIGAVMAMELADNIEDDARKFYAALLR